MQSRVAALVVACAVGSSWALSVITAPDVEAHVKEEMQQNIQIHDTFQSQEENDVRAEGLLKASTDMSALQTHAHAAIFDVCQGITCGPLTCPGGFTATSVEGHCCQYCVNPNIKLESEVTGPTNGVDSTFCPNVRCFPTLCAKTETMPNDANGLCCPECPA
uniref:Uncharacterized protein n=1 Tax=Noctiluca scintillans TaxID=2966 RepID=A0A7S1AUE4_NOCSC